MWFGVGRAHFLYGWVGGSLEALVGVVERREPGSGGGSGSVSCWHGYGSGRDCARVAG